MHQIARYIEENNIIEPNCTERRRGACNAEPFFGEHEGKRYCVLHFPGANKKDAFDIALQKKLSAADSNFSGIWFPRDNSFSGVEIRQTLDFVSAVFSDQAVFNNTTFKSDVNFAGATFSDNARFRHATFAGNVDFSSVTFGKKADFNRARFEGYANFEGSKFIEAAEFRDAVFVQTASFWPATFNSNASFYNASFVRANFSASKFKDKATFNSCVFGSAEFIGTSFSDDADFRFSKFEGLANFNGATFDSAVRLDMIGFDSEARFTFVKFNAKTDFSYTVFKDIVSFSGEHGIGAFGTNATCDFRHARFETPGRVSFHSLTLRPHWFVNMDPREFEFIDVRWIGQLSRRLIDIEIGELRIRDDLETKTAAEKRAERLKVAEAYRDQDAIDELKEEEAEVARIEANEQNQMNARLYRLLSLACRQLASNAEEAHRYDQGSDFRFWSMELHRKEGWKARGGIIGILHILYRYLSGYGEKIGLALGWLVGIWFLFAVLYTQVGFSNPAPAPAVTVNRIDEVGTPQRLSRSLVYSLAVITLQRPDPRPLTTTAWSLVLTESVLGPIQAALLILAVRRRFMR